ncbi:MAG: type III-A CRISPR-associated RAMP protein Csm5 [Chloroflexota bacterium]|nr:type III-A CRISPR-associated RAMP protein Csm5 [Dehalococcoidia bacterium]MDW8254188.1 type III-A CRISPR-associated RAMP protein Csm5 [Chloroflexota bacterium]
MTGQARSFRVVVDVVAPLAVGSGSLPLLPELDYVVHDGALLVYGPESGPRDGAGRLLGMPEPLYRLPFGGTTPPGPVRPVAKDAFGQPLLPGSALKGAFHTLIAAALLERERVAGRLIKKDELAPAARFAAQPLERRLFGAQPRASGFRALRVADARPSDETRLTLAAVRTYGLEARALVPLSDRLAVEAVAPGGRFVGSLVIDEAWLALEHPRLESPPNREAIVEAIALAREEGVRRARAEREYAAAAGAGALVAFYDALLAAAENASDLVILLHLGWGAGWNSKSLGLALTASPDWAQIRADYFGERDDRRRPTERSRPDQRGQGRGRTQQSVFPATRKLVERRGGPALPLGWTLVTLSPLEAPLPTSRAIAVDWEDDAFAVVERPPVAAAAPPREPARPEPATPFAALQALLRPPSAAAPEQAAAPPPPIPRLADRAIKVGMILDAEIIAIEPTRLVVDVGRSEPAVLDAATVGGGNLAVRFTVGQRLRVRVLTLPPFFRIRLA